MHVACSAFAVTSSWGALNSRSADVHMECLVRDVEDTIRALRARTGVGAGIPAPVIVQLWILEDQVVWLLEQLRAGYEPRIVRAMRQVEALLGSIALLIDATDQMRTGNCQRPLDEASRGAREALMDLKESLRNA